MANFILFNLFFIVIFYVNSIYTITAPNNYNDNSNNFKYSKNVESSNSFYPKITYVYKHPQQLEYFSQPQYHQINLQQQKQYQPLPQQKQQSVKQQQKVSSNKVPANYQSQKVQKPIKSAVIKTTPQKVTYKKPVNTAVTSVRGPPQFYKQPVAPTSSNYQYAAAQAAKVAFNPRPTTKNFYQKNNVQAWNEYQRQLQQWQIAVLNGYQPQGNPAANPNYPGNVYIQSAYYPQPGTYPQLAQPYPQPAQPYPQPAQPYPQPIQTYPQPEPAEQQQASPAYPDNGGSTVVESSNQSNPSPPFIPEQPSPPVETVDPSQPPSEFGPEPSQPEEFQPQPPVEFPEPSEPLPPSEGQPIYPPIGPDPTLPEVDNGLETYPGQPGLVPATTEYPSTTEISTETGTTASAEGLLAFCSSPRGQYPSPTSCNSFINCWDDVAVEQECPPGLVFGELNCDYPEVVDCGNRPYTPPSAESGSADNNGTSLCPSSSGTYKSNKNCGAFIVCVGGEAYEFSCPGGTNYNDHLKICDYPYRVDCGDLPPNPSPINPEESEQTTDSNGQPQQPEYPSPSQPEYPAPSGPSQPEYPGPQPEYPSPSQPEYPSPSQPEYPSPSQPEYPSPSQPEYPAPSQPEYPQQPETSPPEYPPTGVPVTETTVVAELPPSYFNHYNYQVKRIPSSKKAFVNTGIRCNTRKVFKLSRGSCDAVSICRGGFTHVVNCSPGTAYDVYQQKCIASYKARC